MKRSNFLKSLLIGIVSPKVVVDAMEDAEKPIVFNSAGTYKSGIIYYDGPSYAQGVDEYRKDYGLITHLNNSDEVVRIKIGQLTQRQPPPKWAKAVSWVQTKNKYETFFVWI